MKKDVSFLGNDNLAGLRKLVTSLVASFIIVLLVDTYIVYQMIKENGQEQGEHSIYIFVLIGTATAILIYLVFVSVVGISRIRQNSQALYKSVKSAEEANAAKTIFLANMSHEIRTPLNAIIGFAALLKESLAEVKSREYADVIHGSALTLLAIINDILDLSKIESGRIDLEMRSFNVNSLMDRIISLYSVRAETKGLTMLYVMDRKVPNMIIGDSLRLQQVISNLLSNAIKFTPEGGTITLSVTSLEDYEERIYLEFTVKDTGIGIPVEVQEKIFQPFSQADGGTSRTFGGTGLGLTISQKILNAMKSKLELKSFIREGSTFSFKVFMDKDMNYMMDHIGDKENKPIVGLYPPKFAKVPMYERLEVILEDICEPHYIGSINGAIELDVFCLFSHSNVMEDYHTLRLFYPEIPVVLIGEKGYIDQGEEDLFSAFYKSPIPEESFTRAINELSQPESKHEEPTREQFIGHVMVAEDNTTNRLLVQILLERLGLTVEFAKDGYEAIAHAKEMDFDLIFMDIHMPKKDGVGATKEIIAIERDLGRLHTPIIALTANALKGDREKYIQAGMDEYLSKPIDEEELIGMLHKFKLQTKVEEEEQPDPSKGVIDDHGQTDREQVTSGSQEEVLPTSYTSTTKSKVDYDVNEAAAAIGIDTQTLDMLIDNFFLTFEKDFKRLEETVKKKNYKEIIESAHYLKGACMNLQFEEGADLFKEVEKFARDDQMDWISLEPIRAHFEALRDLLFSRLT